MKSGCRCHQSTGVIKGSRCWSILDRSSVPDGVTSAYPQHPVPAEGDFDIPSNLLHAMYPVHIHEERRKRTHLTGCVIEKWCGAVESPRRRRPGSGVTKVTPHLKKPTFAFSMDSTSVGATSEETIVV